MRSSNSSGRLKYILGASPRSSNNQGNMILIRCSQHRTPFDPKSWLRTDEKEEAMTAAAVHCLGCYGVKTRQNIHLLLSHKITADKRFLAPAQTNNTLLALLV